MPSDAIKKLITRIDDGEIASNGVYVAHDAIGIGATPLAAEVFFPGCWHVGKPKNLNLSGSKGSVQPAKARQARVGRTLFSAAFGNRGAYTGY
jgi:hypothetical protein